MSARAHLRAEGERGAFPADPGESGFLLTEDLCSNAFFSPSNPSLSGLQYFLETCNMSGHFCLLRRIDVWVVIYINSPEGH